MGQKHGWKGREGREGRGRGGRSNIDSATRDEMKGGRERERGGRPEGRVPLPNVEEEEE